MNSQYTFLFKLFVVTLICFLKITQATNQPSYCTATVTLDNDPSKVIIGGTINITVTSDNAPTLLTSYDVYLYQNGVLVQNISDVDFSLINLGIFNYTFVNVLITNQTTQFYAVIIRNFIIFPLVSIQSNIINVTGRYLTNTTLDRSQPISNPGSGITGNIGSPFLATVLIVTPSVPSGSTPITSEFQICETFVNGQSVPNLNSTGNLIRDSLPSLDFAQDTCNLPGFFNPGDNFVVNVFYPGDLIYAPSFCQVSFVIRSDFNYVAGDVTVTYPTTLQVRDLVSTKSKTKSKKTQKVSKITKKTKKTDKSVRSSTAIRLQ